MERCFQLAANGLGTTYPNPLVGSVIVHQDKIIGEGWHYKAGQPHAEVNAITSVRHKNLLAQSTLYVNLEPCSHHGKTPPCADLIIESGIKNVVICNLDPNPKVAGNGVQKLLAAGCTVKTGVLEEKGNALNKRFFTFHRKKRPYIILKWAETADGYLAPSPETRSEKKPVWITLPKTRQYVHKMRSEETAILVGTTTVLEDNPSLTTRQWSGDNPTRILIDRDLKLTSNLQVFNNEAKTIVLNAHKKHISGTVVWEKIDFEDLTSEICAVLYRHNLQSLIVEGGKKTIQTFLDQNIWDEAFVFSGRTTFGKGIEAPRRQGILVSTKTYGTDTLNIFTNTDK